MDVQLEGLTYEQRSSNGTTDGYELDLSIRQMPLETISVVADFALLQVPRCEAIRDKLGLLLISVEDRHCCCHSLCLLRSEVAGRETKYREGSGKMRMELGHMDLG